MPLGEALDTGAVYLREERYYDPPGYFAVTRDDEWSWEVGKSLFESRTTGTVSIRGRGRK